MFWGPNGIQANRRALSEVSKKDFMLKNILVLRGHLVAATLGIFTALLYLTAPILAAETFPADSNLISKQKLEKTRTLSAKASSKATQALEAGDLALAQEAQTLAGEAADTISQLEVLAADTGNRDLAQAALDASIGVGETLRAIVGAAETIAATSSDADTVAAAEALAKTAAFSQTIINTAQDTASDMDAHKAAAKEGYETPAFNPPVVYADPPINDVQPAGPV